MTDSLSRPNRRRFLQILGVGIAAPTMLSQAACGDDGGTAAVTDGFEYFPESVASGDPRPDSVVLWGRVADADAGDEAEVTLVVATDEALDDVVLERTITVVSEFDHIAKVQVTGLAAGTIYYYRFIYERGSKRLGSRVGRTKTAAAAADDVPVKLALASCQDYIGRYFHSYAKMLEVVDELDVVVHIGDYVYETTGDDFFQAGPTAARRVKFTDEAGAIAFVNGDGETTHHAAQSLSNYRELYRIYRSDPWLQRVHERVPFVFIWDDHEFSDDCWQDTATYFDGQSDELGQRQRRMNGERANFEYLPTVSGLAGDGASFDDLGAKVPINDSSVVIYRDFRFGQHVHLVMTDTRTYRPDHLIPEDVYPSRVALTQAQLVAAGLDPQKTTGEPPAPYYVPYFDLATYAGGVYQAPMVAALTTIYAAQLPNAPASEHAARAEAQATGLWSASTVAFRLKAKIDAGDLPPIVLDGLERGATFDLLRFTPGAVFASNGLHARYLVERVHYDAYAAVRYAADAGSQDVLGPTQEAWLRATIEGSDATWKLVATSISMTAMVVDTRPEAFPASLIGMPDEELVREGIATFSSLLKTSFYLSVDQWDGFPQKRDELLALLRATPNSLLLSGDIHSFYATEHGAGGGANGVVELTAGGISSESFKGFVRGVVDGLVAGISQSPPVAATISHLEDLLQQNFPALKYANNDAAGFITLTIGASEAEATLYMAPVEHALEEAADQAAAVAPYEAVSFTIKDGVLTRK